MSNWPVILSGFISLTRVVYIEAAKQATNLQKPKPPQIVKIQKIYWF